MLRAGSVGFLMYFHVFTRIFHRRVWEKINVKFDPQKHAHVVQSLVTKVSCWVH